EPVVLRRLLEELGRLLQDVLALVLGRDAVGGGRRLEVVLVDGLEIGTDRGALVGRLALEALGALRTLPIAIRRGGRGGRRPGVGDRRGGHGLVVVLDLVVVVERVRIVLVLDDPRGQVVLGVGGLGRRR